jgi:broad specificity phosphatase PhoE
LTPKGLVQARAVGAALFLDNDKALDAIPYDELYCSDLTRVKETLATALNVGGCSDILSTKTIFTPLLREKNAGIFEMRPRRLMVEERKRYGDERTFKPRNGESWEDLQKRVREFLELIKSTPKGSHTDRPWRVLAFTSGGVIKEFVNAFVYGAEIEERISSSESNRLWLAERKYYPNIADNGSMYVFRVIGRNRFEMVIENFRPPLPEFESKSTDEDDSTVTKIRGGKISQKDKNSKQRSVTSTKDIQKASSKAAVGASMRVTK